MSIGFYIHVPFCIRKCSYCDFVSYSHDAVTAASYVYALEQEMAGYAEKFTGDQKKLKSIFIGGGTPTCLSSEQLVSIVEACGRYFTIENFAEITVECNPGTVDSGKFLKLRQAGVNRISIGVQSYQQRLLSFLGRIHDWNQVTQAIRDCRESGIENLNLDLIFGIPGQTIDDWKKSLRRLVDLEPEHISAYNLKIEDGTPLQRAVQEGRIAPCDEELELEMYLYCMDYLIANGYEHYEISNFARPGYQSRHNLTYWRNEEYLGIGPAAHSWLHGRRFSNTENVEVYITRLRNGESVVDSELNLTKEEEISETVFLGLRLLEGLDLKRFQQRYGVSLTELFPQQIRKLKELGLVELGPERLKLTSKGLPLANEVFAEFI